MSSTGSQTSSSSGTPAGGPAAPLPWTEHYPHVTFWNFLELPPHRPIPRHPSLIESKDKDGACTCRELSVSCHLPLLLEQITNSMAFKATRVHSLTAPQLMFKMGITQATWRGPQCLALSAVSKAEGLFRLPEVTCTPWPVAPSSKFKASSSLLKSPWPLPSCVPLTRALTITLRIPGQSRVNSPPQDPPRAHFRAVKTRDAHCSLPTRGGQPRAI